jgi:hypothetical protein
MPADLSEFVALSQPKKKQCPLSGVLEVLPADEAAMLRAALAEDVRTITTSAVIKWLERRDMAANVSQVTSHRRGTCSCAGECP